MLLVSNEVKACMSVGKQNTVKYDSRQAVKFFNKALAELLACPFNAHKEQPK